MTAWLSDASTAKAAASLWIFVFVGLVERLDKRAPSVGGTQNSAGWSRREARTQLPKAVSTPRARNRRHVLAAEAELLEPCITYRLLHDHPSSVGAEAVPILAYGVGAMTICVDTCEPKQGRVPPTISMAGSPRAQPALGTSRSSRPVGRTSARLPIFGSPTAPSRRVRHRVSRNGSPSSQWFAKNDQARSDQRARLDHARGGNPDRMTEPAAATTTDA
jgi:hypothetical protein